VRGLRCAQGVCGEHLVDLLAAAAGRHDVLLWAGEDGYQRYALDWPRELLADELVASNGGKTDSSSADCWTSGCLSTTCLEFMRSRNLCTFSLGFSRRASRASLWSS
jgi:hypothetical protein